MSNTVTIQQEPELITGNVELTPQIQIEKDIESLLKNMGIEEETEYKNMTDCTNDDLKPRPYYRIICNIKKLEDVGNPSDNLKKPTVDSFYGFKYYLRKKECQSSGMFDFSTKSPICKEITDILQKITQFLKDKNIYVNQKYNEISQDNKINEDELQFLLNNLKDDNETTRDIINVDSNRRKTTINSLINALMTKYKIDIDRDYYTIKNKENDDYKKNGVHEKIEYYLKKFKTEIVDNDEVNDENFHEKLENFYQTHRNLFYGELPTETVGGSKNYQIIKQNIDELKKVIIINNPRDVDNKNKNEKFYKFIINALIKINFDDDTVDVKTPYNDFMSSDLPENNKKNIRIIAKEAGIDDLKEKEKIEQKKIQYEKDEGYYNKKFGENDITSKALNAVGVNNNTVPNIVNTTKNLPSIISDASSKISELMKYKNIGGKKNKTTKRNNKKGKKTFKKLKIIKTSKNKRNKNTHNKTK